MIPNIIDLKLDENNWNYVTIEAQDLATVNGIDAIEQHLNQRFKFFRGEYKHDLRRGIPYHDEFFKKRPNPVVIDTILKSVIIDTPGVIELLEFKLEIINSTRTLQVIFKASTDEGILDYSGNIPLG
jgi:hypothetical protein